MIRLVKDKLNDNTLNDSIKSFRTTIDGLKNAYANESQMLSNNLVTINGWMTTMNNYYYNLMAYKAFIQSLEEQGVIIKKDPVYCWCWVARSSSLGQVQWRFERMQWTKKPILLNSTRQWGKRIDTSQQITPEEAEYLIANGSEVKFCYLEWISQGDGETFSRWDVAYYDIGEKWAPGTYQEGSIRITTADFDGQGQTYPTAQWTDNIAGGYVDYGRTD